MTDESPIEVLEPSVETRERIRLMIEVGNTPQVAVVAAGFTEDDFDEWMGLEDELCLQFQAAIKEATAKAEASLVGLIYRSATNGSAAAAQWLLERGYGGRWARPTAAMKNNAAEDPVPAEDGFAALDNVTDIRTGRRS